MEGLGEKVTDISIHSIFNIDEMGFSFKLRMKKAYQCHDLRPEDARNLARVDWRMLLKCLFSFPESKHKYLTRYEIST